MKTIAMAGVVALCACAHGQAKPPDQALLDWHNKYPLAAQDFCATQQAANPIIARNLQQWERDNPAVASDMLQWAATHPGEPLPAFLRDHPSLQTDAWFWGHSGVNLLFHWAQRHPEAAMALSDEPDILSWSAQHQAC